VRGYQGLLPEPLSGMPASMMHFFLGPEVLTGRNIADMLGLPAPDWTFGVTHMAVELDELLFKLGIDNPLTSKLAGLVGRALIRAFLSAERADRAAFSIPLSLHALWEINAADVAEP